MMFKTNKLKLKGIGLRVSNTDNNNQETKAQAKIKSLYINILRTPKISLLRDISKILHINFSDDLHKNRMSIQNKLNNGGNNGRRK